MVAIPAANISHDWKSHAAPHFNYLDQRNAVVPLMMPLASDGADAGASGIDMTIKGMLHLISLVLN